METPRFVITAPWWMEPDVMILFAFAYAVALMILAVVAIVAFTVVGVQGLIDARDRRRAQGRALPW